MGDNEKDQKPIFYEPSSKFKNFSSFSSSFHSIWPISKVMVSLIVLITLPYVFYTLSFMLYSFSGRTLPSSSNVPAATTAVIRAESWKNPEKTDLKHIHFGIAGSAKLWDRRKNYVKVWWRPNEMNGVVWLDKPLNGTVSSSLPLPQIRISADTSKFKYRNRRGRRSAIRITRIVSETVRLLNGTATEKNVRWLVMGDDDTVFFPENLVKVLRKYDHKQFYYIGSSSESHLQNIHFSYGMAYGGGGFAISYPLAKALEKILDRCIERYPELYGSDDRVHACMAELGVPLTKEPGFHQFDIFGRLLGLLSAHPVAPLVSIHHLDVVEPIFPNMARVEALKRLMVPSKLDSASLMQQSICYDTAHRWTVSVAWGYAVHITRGVLYPRQMEMPMRTFLDWYKRSDYKLYALNTRPISENMCQRPRVYYLSNALYNNRTGKTASEYVRQSAWTPECDWDIPDPSEIDRIQIYKRPDPDRWDKAPRRNCCRVLPSKENGTMVIDVGECEEGESIEFR